MTFPLLHVYKMLLIMSFNVCFMKPKYSAIKHKWVYVIFVDGLFATLQKNLTEIDWNFG